MTIEQDIEILKSIASARENAAREYFSNPHARLYCPRCGSDNISFDDVINSQKIIYCRYCQSDYLIRIRSHTRQKNTGEIKN